MGPVTGRDIFTVGGITYSVIYGYTQGSRERGMYVLDLCVNSYRGDLSRILRRASNGCSTATGVRKNKRVALKAVADDVNS